MKRTLILCLAVALVFVSCKRKSEPPAATSDVMLARGTGALIVQFPETRSVDRGEWMSQVQLVGTADTRALPRIPMAELKSAVVLNIPPGSYNVSAVAWQRKLRPTMGGSLAGVAIREGEVLVLKAQPLGDDVYPFPGTALSVVGYRPWQLPGKEAMREYVTELLQSGTKG